MNNNEKNILDGMTAEDILNFLDKATDVQYDLIKLGIEFIKRTKQNDICGMEDNLFNWRFDGHENRLTGTYLIVYEWYCRGEIEDVPFHIPYLAIDDMDKAVAEYFEEKARQEERARQRKLAEEQEKEQVEYEEYLRLKEKFESQLQQSKE